MANWCINRIQLEGLNCVLNDFQNKYFTKDLETGSMCFNFEIVFDKAHLLTDIVRPEIKIFKQNNQLIIHFDSRYEPPLELILMLINKHNDIIFNYKYCEILMLICGEVYLKGSKYLHNIIENEYEIRNFNKKLLRSMNDDKNII